MKSILKIWKRSPLQFILTPSVAIVPDAPNLKLHSGHTSKIQLQNPSIDKDFYHRHRSFHFDRLHNGSCVPPIGKQ